MATPTIQQGRLITKRSAIPGTVPTVPAVDDIETFIPTDIFKGELFYNIPDNILYTRDNTGIIIISGGGGTTYVYYTENTTPGSEYGQIEVIDGSDSSYVKTEPTQTEIYSSDGTNTTTRLQTSNSITSQSSDATNASTIIQTPLAGGGPLDGKIRLYSTNSSLNANFIMKDTEIRTVVNGALGYDSYNLVTENSILSKVDNLIGAYSEFEVSDGGVITTSTDGTNTNTLTVNADGSGDWGAVDGTNTGSVSIVSTQASLQSTDGLNYTQLRCTSTGDSYWEVTDGGFNNTSITLTPTTTSITSTDGAYSNAMTINGDGTADWIATSGVTTNTTTVSLLPTIFSVLSSVSGTSDAIISISPNKVRLNNNYLSAFYIPTTNNTPTTQTILTYATGVTNQTKSINISINAYNITDDTSYGSTIFGVFRWTTSSFTQVSTIDLVEKSEMVTATSTLIVSGTNISVRVTGETGKTINWTINVEIK